MGKSGDQMFLAFGSSEFERQKLDVLAKNPLKNEALR